MATNVEPQYRELEEGLNSEGLTLAGAETAVALRPGADIEVMSYHTEAVKLLEYAGRLTIFSIKDVTAATDDLTVISRLKKAMEAKRKEYLAPLKEQTDAIQETYKYLMEPVLKADQLFRGKVLDYQREQQRRKDEADAITRMEREAAERKAKLEGTPLPTTPVIIQAEVKTHVETDYGATSQKMITKYEVVDFATLPDTYKMADTAKLTKTIKAGGMNVSIPGVRIYQEAILQVNAR
jgi:hypothetical protein